MSDPFENALRFLPHGPEFRFLDRLLDLKPGSSGVGEYQVRGDESFLPGHFPGQPIMPAVLLIEAAAQLAGTLAQTDPQISPLTGLKLTAIRGAKILGAARPGDVIRLEARIIGRMGHLVQAQATATVNATVVLQVELTLSGELTASGSDS
jgi:3-hydroxyacyl-[acyl-carrier-protein] dehydratase